MTCGLLTGHPLARAARSSGELWPTSPGAAMQYRPTERNERGAIANSESERPRFLRQAFTALVAGFATTVLVGFALEKSVSAS